MKVKLKKNFLQVVQSFILFCANQTHPNIISRFTTNNFRNP